MRPAPESGVIEAGAHYFPVRIYFEDTDLSGLIYHANYLRYMERARSDLLRVLGIDQQAAFDAGEGVYAVASLDLRYVRPARMGDALTVETRGRALSAASLILDQKIYRAEELLTEGSVRVAFLSMAGRPKRQPKEWLERFRQFFSAC